MHEKYAKLILREVNLNLNDYTEAMEYTKQRNLKFPDKFCALMLYVPVPTYKGMFEVRVEFKDGKHELTICELTEDCSYRFSGRLLFRGYDCWDLKTQTRLLYKRLNIDPKKAKQAQENAKKRVPTLEELLPPSLAEKVNTRKFKSFVEERFPSTSPAYRVIMPEKDEMTKIEYMSKLETWIRIIKISLSSTG